MEFLLEESLMNLLSWTIVMFSVAIVTAVLGFGGLVLSAATLMQVLSFSFLALFLAMLMVTLFTGGRQEARDH